jgi:hypothetical protein
MSDESGAPSGVAAGPAESGPAKWLRTRAAAPWSEELARRVVERVAEGELLYRVLREAGMPTPQTVGRWAKARPDFGQALEAARLSSGRRPRGGGVSRYCPATAEEVIQRLCEGEALTRVCDDPTMPCHSTVFLWRRQHAEFNEAYQMATQVRAERLADKAEALADGATPQTAYVTHVRLAHLRWYAGVLAPRKYRIRMSEPDTPRETINLVMRRFESETDPETGKMKVVCYAPNPWTGEVEREDTPGWTPPPNTLGMPGGWDTHPGGRFGLTARRGGTEED